MKGKYPSGGAVDDRVPERAAKLLAEHGVNDPEFIEWLGDNLGRYRLYSVQHPGMKEQLRDIRQLAKLMARVRECLALDSLPPECRAICNDVSWKVHGELFFDREKRLQHDLLKAAGLLEHSAKVMAGRARRGPQRTKTLRGEIIDGIVKRLVQAGRSLTESREIAAEICIACGIPAPASERAVRRVTKKKISKTPD